MITGFLKDVAADTFISQLPSIIGYNNRSIEKEFEFLFDPSANAMTQSLENKDGYVDVHWGRFKNVETDYIKINDTSSLSKMLSGASHNSFGGRFVSEPADSAAQDEYCHDASAIYINANMSLYQLLLSMQQRITALENKLS